MAEELSEVAVLAIAEHLFEKGHAETATNLVVDLVRRQPNSVKGLAILGHLAYKRKDWQLASEFWNGILNIAPDHLEANVKLTHCLIELGDTAADLQAARLSEVLTHAPISPHENQDDLLKVVYEQVCLYFLSKRWSQGLRLLKACELPNSYFKRVTVEAPPGYLTDESIRERINRATSEWTNASPELPSLRHDHSPAPPLISIAGKRVLLVFRKFFLSSSDSREHELTAFLRASARSAGLNFSFFPAEPFLSPTLFTPQQQYEAIDRLAQGILRVNPEVIVFDDLCVTDPPGEYAGPRAIRSMLAQLREKLGFKLIAFYADVWTEKSETGIGLARSVADVIWHQGSEISLPGGVKIRQSCNAPIPYPDEMFSPQAGKDIETAFVGGLREYNFPRGIWLTLIRNYELPCEILLSNHTKSGSAAGASPEEYARFMSRIKISVNFSARTPSRKIVTGRVWESIISKSLLLEEDNPELLRYFVPFVHYIPFRTIEELGAYLRFFQKNPEVRDAVTEQAFSWFTRAFGKERVWQTLISMAFEA